MDGLRLRLARSLISCFTPVLRVLWALRTVVLAGDLARARAVLVTDPCFASNDVTSYAPERHVVECPGASVVEVQWMLTPALESFESTIERLCSVCVPVLVTVNTNCRKSPLLVAPSWS